MRNILIMVLATAFMTGCVTAPQERYPEFSKRSLQLDRVAVAIDVLMVDDIEGSIDGVNEDKHKTVAPKLGEEVITDLAEHGYNATVAHLNGGLFLTPDDEPLVFHVNDVSTGVNVAAPFVDLNNKSWASEPVRSFMRDVMQKARAYTAPAYEADQAKSTRPNVTTTTEAALHVKSVGPIVEIPQEIKYLSDDVLMIIEARSRDVGIGKSMGVAMATGMLTGILTGGLYVASAPVSYCEVDIAVLDLHSGEIIWHSTDRVKGNINGAEKIHGMTHELLTNMPSRVNEVVVTR